MRGLSLVAACGGHSSSRCAGLSLSRPLLLRSTGSRRAGSVVVAHGCTCSVACGIFPDQGSNPCPLHWQADSQPLRHQGSPPPIFCLLVSCKSFSVFKGKLTCPYVLIFVNGIWLGFACLLSGKVSLLSFIVLMDIFQFVSIILVLFICLDFPTLFFFFLSF